jgi:hypothetical protein
MLHHKHQCPSRFPHYLTLNAHIINKSFHECIIFVPLHPTSTVLPSSDCHGVNHALYTLHSIGRIWNQRSQLTALAGTQKKICIYLRLLGYDAKPTAQTLKMKAASTFDTSLTIYQPTPRHIPEHESPLIHLGELLISHKNDVSINYIRKSIDLKVIVVTRDIFHTHIL